MEYLIEEYGAVLISIIIASILLGTGYWLLTALKPLVVAYINTAS